LSIQENEQKRRYEGSLMCKKRTISTQPKRPYPFTFETRILMALQK